MESLIFRSVCRLHFRQLKASCQSWKQFSSLNKQFASVAITIPRSYCTKSSDGKGKTPSSESPFMSPVGKPPSKEDTVVQKMLKNKRKQENKKQDFAGVIVASVSAIGFIVLYFYTKHRIRQNELKSIKESMGTSENEVLIGGDWALVNQNGEKVTNKDYEGQWCLIYFGFTHCPDICPDELEKIVEIMEILGRNKHLPKLRALFVTVDPERDTPPAMKKYLSEFSDKFVGLTGNWEELKKILNAFKVYYSRGPKDEDGDYIVDHSIITYLMNPSGKYEAHFPRSRTNVEVANIIEQKMRTWTPKS